MNKLIRIFLKRILSQLPSGDLPAEQSYTFTATGAEINIIRDHLKGLIK